METVEPGVYRRQSGKYVVPIYDPATGRKRYSHPDVPRGGFDTLEEARAFKTRLRDEARRSQRSQETCDEFAKRWPETHPRPEETTNIHHRERLKAFIRDFEGMPLSDVSRPMARLWTHGGPAPRQLEKIAMGWKGAERVDGEVVVPDHIQIHKVVRAMFNDAVDDQLIATNPFRALKVPESNGRSEILVLTDDELGKLVRCAEEEWGDYGATTFGPMILVAAGTGMRPGELFAMRWSWVDWEHDDIEIRRMVQTATGKETLPGRTRKAKRTVAMIPMVRAALQRIPKHAGDDHVFFNQSGRVLSQRSHWYYWSPVRSRFYGGLGADRKAEIDPRFDWYELRHYFGTYLASLGVSPYDIADQMGHADGGTLAMKLYIHVRSQDARDRVRAAVQRAQAPGIEPPAHGREAV